MHMAPIREELRRFGIKRDTRQRISVRDGTVGGEDGSGGRRWIVHVYEMFF